jgi:hypothetical protein
MRNLLDRLWLGPWRRWIVIYCGLVAGMFLLWGLAATYTALDHNPQGEFCAYVDEGEPANWSSQGGACRLRWGEIGLLWFVLLVPTAPFLVLPLLVLFVRWLWRHSRADSRP